MVGTPMKSGQSCGNEGSNVYVDRASAPSQPTYVGCYADNPTNRVMDDQSVDNSYGGNYTYDMCKQRAADMGKPFFSVRSAVPDDTKQPNKGVGWCAVGSTKDEVTKYGSSYKPEVLWSSGTGGKGPGIVYQKVGVSDYKFEFHLSSTGASGGVLKIIAKTSSKGDITIWSGGPTDITEPCKYPTYGGKINDIVATYGANCVNEYYEDDSVLYSKGSFTDSKGKPFSHANAKGNYSQIVSNKCNNKETCKFYPNEKFRDDFGTTTAGDYNPAYGCDNKQLEISYNCGSIEKSTKYEKKYWYNTLFGKNIGSRHAYFDDKTLVLDCKEETKKCKLYRVQVNNNGSFAVLVDGKENWNNGTSGISDITVGEKSGLFNKKGGKGGGLNYFNNKLLPGEYIVSDNGQFVLYFTPDADIQLLKFVTTCSTDNSMNYGLPPQPELSSFPDYANLDSEAVYQMSIPKAGNIGKIGYVDGQSRLHNYPSSMISKGTGYVNTGNFNSVGNDLKTVTNIANVDSCKKACTDLDNCHGFTYNTEKTQCVLKDENMYPAGTRVMDSNYELYIRSLSVNNHNTCSKQVVPIDSGLWDRYPQGATMTLGTLCDLGVISRPELAKLKILNKEIVGTAKQIYKRIKKLTRENSNLGKRMGIEKEYMDKQIRKFKDIYHRLQKEKLSDDQTVAGMLSDADINSTMNSNRYIMWSILAIIVAIFTIHLIRK